mgnify:CR=1 FL=1
MSSILSEAVQLISYFHRCLESLDDLERRVVTLFKDVENKNRENILYSFKHHPWGPEQLKNKIYIVPLSDDAQELRVTFPTPEIRDNYKSAVSRNSSLLFLS